jgi:hypothetical protein
MHEHAGLTEVIGVYRLTHGIASVWLWLNIPGKKPYDLNDAKVG